MAILTPLELYFLCIFDIADKKQIEEWADNQFSIQEEPNTDLLSLYDKDIYKARGSFVLVFNDLDIDSDINNKEPYTICINIIKMVCQKYLKHEETPFNFCRFVNSIESYFNDNLMRNELGEFIYPEFLGNLYNACDWCDKTWNHENSQHLEIEVKETLSSLQNS